MPTNPSQEQSAGPSIQQIKTSMRATWMSGNFAVLAAHNVLEAAAFVERVAPPPGACVLDLACGSGNVAIPAARRGCHVTGADIALNLLEQARQRASTEGLVIGFDEADAEELPYPDASFDYVFSMFGAMFAPRPELVARECARVLRPGGTLAMANWTPDSFTASLSKVTAKHVPPPPDIPPPVLWGHDHTVRTRLEPHFASVTTQLVPLNFDFPFSAAGTVDFFRTWFGPIHTAFARLDSNGQQALALDLETLWAKHNSAPDPQNHVIIANEYLQVIAIRA